MAGKKHKKKEPVILKSENFPKGSIARALNETKETNSWSWETFAEKVRAAGMNCTSRSIHRWASGLKPHANNERLLQEALKKLKKYSNTVTYLRN